MRIGLFTIARFCIPLGLFFCWFGQAQVRFSYAEKSDFDWNDLQGRVDAQSPFAASVNTGISYSYVTDENGLLDNDKSEVTAYFYPKLSWYNPKRINNKILAHERLHFAISELHARMLRKQLAELVYAPNAKAQVKKIYAEIENSRRAMQDLFDDETQHSLTLKAELEWELKIIESLKDFSKWAGS